MNKTKWHIIPDGTVRECHAQCGRCPYASAFYGDGRHFNTKKEAERAAQLEMETDFKIKSLSSQFPEYREVIKTLFKKAASHILLRWWGEIDKNTVFDFDDMFDEDKTILKLEFKQSEMRNWLSTLKGKLYSEKMGGLIREEDLAEANLLIDSDFEQMDDDTIHDLFNYNIYKETTLEKKRLDKILNERISRLSEKEREMVDSDYLEKFWFRVFFVY